ncbi:MAG: MaoC/PaaZ C-terminal domain-containing protein [Pseudomonadota bacterium]
MPFCASAVGQTTEGIEHAVDARWLMAYSAALDDMKASHVDTASREIVAHPVFPVCLEWPVILSCASLPGQESVTAEERARSVHAAHDLHLFRPIRPGDVLTTRATMAALERGRAGVAQIYRLDTTDAQGRLVCRTYQRSVSRGAEMRGDPAHGETLPVPPVDDTPETVETRLPVSIAANAAHVYTECARIWNPIHTDRRSALAAGLPDTILHGTATLAMAVTRIVDVRLAGEPDRVVRLGGRFSAMVRMPAILTLEIHARRDDVVPFTLRNEEGEPVVSRGFLQYR